jgi:hypothetical protein
MPQFGSHPARLAAIAAGEKKWRGPACPEHGDTLRHSTSGQCVACNRQRSAIQAMAKSGRRERYVKMADRPERVAALARGAIVYWGLLCPNGHSGQRKNRSPRYTLSSRCVACAQSHGRPQTDMTMPASDVPDAPTSAPPPPSQGATRENSFTGAAGRARQALHRTADRLRSAIMTAR